MPPPASPAIPARAEAVPGAGRAQRAGPATVRPATLIGEPLILPARRDWSLRARLSTLLLGSVLFAWLASGAWLYRIQTEQTDRQFDTALVYAAHALLAVLAHEAPESDQIDLTPVTEARVDQLVYQLRVSGGPVLMRSPGAPLADLAPSSDTGFSVHQVEHRDYRVYTLATSDGLFTIHVGQPASVRATMAHAAALEVLLPAVLLLLVLELGLWLIVRSVTAPVARFARELDARAAEDTMPMSATDLPAELRPVETAVIGLVQRMQSALLHERTLTADAAHELRTPLAALRTQAQVALRTRDPVDRDEALRDVIAGSDRAARLIGAVLTLAQLDARRSCVYPRRNVDLAALVRQVQADFGSTARRQGVELTTGLAVPVIEGDEDALAIALRNLVDNALRYARSEIRIESHAEDSAVALVVRDDGPGMTEEVAQRAFDRFYRGERGTATGSGLGLSLVRRIAQLHSGTVRLADGLRGTGTSIELVLPQGQAKNADISASSAAGASSAR